LIEREQRSVRHFSSRSKQLDKRRHKTVAMSNVEP
uniref:Transposase n=1 Tax=Hydatigena taeniaeformis TaxID=6205 RepID=A0A0R3XB72_HYDTA